MSPSPLISFSVISHLLLFYSNLLISSAVPSFPHSSFCPGRKYTGLKFFLQFYGVSLNFVKFWSLSERNFDSIFVDWTSYSAAFHRILSIFGFNSLLTIVFSSAPHYAIISLFQFIFSLTLFLIPIIFISNFSGSLSAFHRISSTAHFTLLPGLLEDPG